MTGQGNHVLISYSDGSKDSQAIADQLAAELRPRMYPETREYSQSRINNQPPCDYDWLILVYSPEARRSAVYQTVENALDLTVKRHMRGVLAITPGPAELPAEWTTIRKYDASTPPETIRQAMSYAKTPYMREKMQDAHPFVRSRTAVRLLAVLILFVVVVAVYIAFTQNNPPQELVTPPGLTATAQAFNKILTATIKNLQASATVSAEQALYDATTKSSPLFTAFRDNEAWDTSTPGCAFLDSQNATYQVTSATPNQYVKCMATMANFKNFAYQVTMKISGDAGGIIFRSDEKGTFYRFSVTINPTTPESGEYGIYQCNANQCTTANNVSDGTPLAKPGLVQVDPNGTITLTVIAKDSMIDLYVDGKSIAHLTNQPVLSGKIGVYAAYLNSVTTVTFTNPRVWQLDKQPKSQPTPRG